MIQLSFRTLKLENIGIIYWDYIPSIFVQMNNVNRDRQTDFVYKELYKLFKFGIKYKKEG
jgi:hypothetical protein